MDGIFWVLAGFKMPFSRPNCKSLTFYIHAPLTPFKTEGFIIWSRGGLKGVYFPGFGRLQNRGSLVHNFVWKQTILANLWAGALLFGIFSVLVGFKMLFSRPNCKSLAFYVYAPLTPLKLKDLYSLSPSRVQIANFSLFTYIRP